MNNSWTKACCSKDKSNQNQQSAHSLTTTKSLEASIWSQAFISKQIGPVRLAFAVSFNSRSVWIRLRAVSWLTLVPSIAWNEE